MSWKKIISRFNEHVIMIYNARFSVKYLVGSVVFILLYLKFTEVVCN